jgi:hypothetical protein
MEINNLTGYTSTGTTKMILLNKEQAEQVKGSYGKYSALDPIQVVEGFALPLEILNDQEFDSVKDLLLTLPQQEVTFLPPPELPIFNN